MGARLRRWTLAAHVTFSVGWLGAVTAYVPLSLAGLRSENPQLVRAAYLAMDLIGWWVIVPLSLLAFFSGLLQAFGTKWGLFRHYWVVAKFVITLIAVTVLILHMPSVTQVAASAAETELSNTDLRVARTQLVIHACGGLAVLLTATILSVLKPWGRTPYGRRSLGEGGKPSGPDALAGANAVGGRSWKFYVLLGLAGLLALIVISHLADGGPQRH